MSKEWKSPTANIPDERTEKRAEEELNGKDGNKSKH